MRSRRLGLIEEAQHNHGRHFFDMPQNYRIETRNDDPLAHVVPSNAIGEPSRHASSRSPRAFYLNVDEQAFAEGVEDLVQSRNLFTVKGMRKPTSGIQPFQFSKCEVGGGARSVGGGVDGRSRGG